MSRRFTLEEYLEEFADEHTEPSDEELTLHVTDAQVHNVGLFFIECMGGILQCLQREQEMLPPHATLKVEQGIKLTHEVNDEVIDEVTKDEDDFIN